jgi:hypothetical protein
LKDLAFSHDSARLKAYKQAADAIEAFKKLSRPRGGSSPEACDRRSDRGVVPGRDAGRRENKLYHRAVMAHVPTPLTICPTRPAAATTSAQSRGIRESLRISCVRLRTCDAPKPIERRSMRTLISSISITATIPNHETNQLSKTVPTAIANVRSSRIARWPDVAPQTRVRQKLAPAQIGVIPRGEIAPLRRHWQIGLLDRAFFPPTNPSGKTSRCATQSTINPTAPTAAGSKNGKNPDTATRHVSSTQRR